MYGLQLESKYHYNKYIRKYFGLKQKYLKISIIAYW